MAYEVHAVSSAFDPTELLRVLVAPYVDFIIVGGVAGILAGSPIATRDLDLVYDRSEDNIKRLSAALALLDARYKDPAGRQIRPDSAKLRKIRVNLLSTAAGDLDLLQTIGEEMGFSNLTNRTVDYELGSLRVKAIDLKTLIAAKAFANRPKDHHSLPFLRELLRLQLEPSEK